MEEYGIVSMTTFGKVYDGDADDTYHFEENTSGFQHFFFSLTFSLIAIKIYNIECH